MQYFREEIYRKIHKTLSSGKLLQYKKDSLIGNKMITGKLIRQNC